LDLVYQWVFCPALHSLPLMEGVSDRLIVGVLGEKQPVSAYADQCSRHLLSGHDQGLFLSQGQNVHPNGKTDIEEGILLSVYPKENYFPLSVWLFGLWETQGGRSKAWPLAPQMNGLVLVVDPATLMGRRGAGAPLGDSPADLLVKFVESTKATPGIKLPISLAVVLGQCDALIHDGTLPRCMSWNLPHWPDSGYNPLVQRDTSAKLGGFVAGHAPSLYKLAQDWFSSVSFFGMGTRPVSGVHGKAHRPGDAVTWMLAERKQVPIMNVSKAFEQLGSYESGDYVFG
jgi:hypothetical protein